MESKHIKHAANLPRFIKPQGKKENLPIKKWTLKNLGVVLTCMVSCVQYEWIDVCHMQISEIPSNGNRYNAHTKNTAGERLAATTTSEIATRPRLKDRDVWSGAVEKNSTKNPFSLLPFCGTQKAEEPGPCRQICSCDDGFSSQ